MKTFRYGDKKVHPLTVLAPVVEAPAVVDYQICQTADGVHANLVVRDTLDQAVLTADLRRALAEVGLPHPRVSIRIVDALERDRATGKIRRLVPLDASADATGARA
jgi:hypothetical protein